VTRPALDVPPRTLDTVSDAAPRRRYAEEVERMCERYEPTGAPSSSVPATVDTSK